MSRQGGLSRRQDGGSRKSAGTIVIKQHLTKGKETPPEVPQINIPALVLPTIVAANKKNSDVDCFLNVFSIFCECICVTDSCVGSESESDNEPLTCDLVF